MTASGFPRVTLPGIEVDPALRIALDEAEREEARQAEHIAAQRVGMVAAMLRLGYKPYMGTAKRRRKPTAHVRRMRRLAARSTR